MDICSQAPSDQGKSPLDSKGYRLVRHPTVSSWRKLNSCAYHNLQEMSAGGAFGGNRGLRPVPPEKGVFPLDHMHECDLEKKEYLACLKSSSYHSERCRDFSKKYLQCRMEKNLMAKQDMSELGFLKDSKVRNSQETNAPDLSRDNETVSAITHQ